MTKLLLIIHDLMKPFEVQCDACGESLGVILFQEGHPIAYESRRLNPQEQVLGFYEKELLAIIHALQSWKHYFCGTPFVFQTNHQSLCYFVTQKKASEKQMQWANLLSQFLFHISHVARKQTSMGRCFVLTTYGKCNDGFKSDTNFAQIYEQVDQGVPISPYSIKEGFLTYA